MQPVSQDTRQTRARLLHAELQPAAAYEELQQVGVNLRYGQQMNQWERKFLTSLYMIDVLWTIGLVYADVLVG